MRNKMKKLILIFVCLILLSVVAYSSEVKIDVPLDTEEIFVVVPKYDVGGSYAWAIRRGGQDGPSLTYTKKVILWNRLKIPLPYDRKFNSYIGAINFLKANYAIIKVVKDAIDDDYFVFCKRKVAK